MKVKDLIKKLEALDQDAEVIVTSSNFELNGASVPVSYVHQYNEGSKKVQTFRDAFDGYTYSKETWLINGGKTPVVMVL
jgi:uncharacterized protein YkuJ